MPKHGVSCPDTALPVGYVRTFLLLLSPAFSLSLSLCLSLSVFLSLSLSLPLFWQAALRQAAWMLAFFPLPSCNVCFCVYMHVCVCAHVYILCWCVCLQNISQYFNIVSTQLKYVTKMSQGALGSNSTSGPFQF